MVCAEGYLEHSSSNKITSWYYNTNWFTKKWPLRGSFLLLPWRIVLLRHPSRKFRSIGNRSQTQKKLTRLTDLQIYISYRYIYKSSVSLIWDNAWERPHLNLDFNRMEDKTCFKHKNFQLMFRVTTKPIYLRAYHKLKNDILERLSTSNTWCGTDQDKIFNRNQGPGKQL